MEILTGVLVSIFVEAEKHYGQKLNSFQTLVFVFVASLFAALFVAVLQKTGYWGTFIEILLVAGGTHNIILRQLPGNKKL